MNPPSRLALVLLAFLTAALPVSASPIPNVSKVYAITVKGDCYSVTPSAIPGGKRTVKYLRSFQQLGRMQITPRVVTTTTNGNNIREAILLVDHAVTGGVGALQYATNGDLYKYITPGLNAPIDFAYVAINSTATTMTITPDKTRLSTANFFKVDAGLVPEFYETQSGQIVITFLANGRVSGKFTLNGQGLVQGTKFAAIVCTFSGKVTTGTLDQ